MTCSAHTFSGIPVLPQAVQLGGRAIGRLRHWSLYRRWERRLRFKHVCLVSLGDTNARFYRPGWQTVDLVDADYVCDLRADPLPFDDDSVDAIYSSHLLEHLQHPRAQLLLEEIYRSLKPGGCCRIATPDMDLLLARYRAADRLFFLRADGRFILERVCSGGVPPEALLMHNRLVGWFASYSGRLDSAGGPIADKATVDSKLATLDKYAFRDWCVSLLEPGRIYAHVHIYDYDELRSLFVEAGFDRVRRAAYAHSDCPAMRDPPIDRKKHRAYSMYVEATKCGQ